MFLMAIYTFCELPPWLTISLYYTSIFDATLSLILIEFNRRYQIFKKNLLKAELFQKHDNATGRYGITKFSDLTGLYLGLNDSSYGIIISLDRNVDVASYF